jgi:hypothetical protein
MICIISFWFASSLIAVDEVLEALVLDAVAALPWS